jgi:hypothetical protein
VQAARHIGTNDFVAELTQFLGERIIRRVSLEHDPLADGAEIRKRRRLRRIELPIDEADNRLHHIGDDRRAAG